MGDGGVGDTVRDAAELLPGSGNKLTDLLRLPGVEAGRVQAGRMLLSEGS